MQIFVGPFQRRFPKAQVWVTPQQWSWPINLPVQFYGIFPTGELSTGDADAPWDADFDIKVFAAPRFASIGLYSETAMFHRSSKTLLVTDAVIQLPRKPPECLSPGTLSYLPIFPATESVSHHSHAQAARRLFCSPEREKHADSSAVQPGGRTHRHIVTKAVQMNMIVLMIAIHFGT
jgi:hypothetical protein